MPPRVSVPSPSLSLPLLLAHSALALECSLSFSLGLFSAHRIDDQQWLDSVEQSRREKRDRERQKGKERTVKKPLAASRCRRRIVFSRHSSAVEAHGNPIMTHVDPFLHLFPLRATDLFSRVRGVFVRPSDRRRRGASRRVLKIDATLIVFPDNRREG